MIAGAPGKAVPRTVALLRGKRARALGAAATTFVACAGGCAPRDPPGPRPSGAGARGLHEAPRSTAPAALAPLTEASWLERIALEGPGAARDALVSVPLGATAPRPVVVAVHGADDRPEWACGAYRGATDAFPFVVCPEGDLRANGKRAWADAATVADAVERALPALRRRFGVFVAAGPVALVGFGQGGRLVTAALPRIAAPVDRVVLIETGGGAPALAPFAVAAARGGIRVLLACSTPGCAPHLAVAGASLREAGLDARIADLGPHVHNLNAEVVASLRGVTAGLLHP